MLMKVLHVIPSVADRSGGPATAIVPMCRALKQHGIEVLLVTTDATMSGGKPPFLTCSLPRSLEEEQVRKGGWSPISCDYKGVPTIFFPTQLGESFKYSRPLSSWLNSNIHQFNLAHIHAVFNYSSLAAAHVCRKAGVPYVVRPLGTLEPWSMAQKSLRKRMFWQISGKGMLRRAAAVHYTTEAEKLSTERLLGLNHGKVIALGIEANSRTSTTLDHLWHYFPSLASESYVLVLSRLHPKKGLDVLIEAFLSLVQDRNYAHWRLVIAGDGDADYVQRLKAMSKSDRIIFTGWLDGEKKDAVLSGASLLVLPSYQENFGLCVMEALSHSVPVLVSPHVNLAEQIVLANAGWIATVNKHALISRLSEALGDEAERARRGQAGKQLSEKYSWDSTAKNLVDLYAAIQNRAR
jgi:glycosyltransferase involved in cell wall biosynthesis